MPKTFILLLLLIFICKDIVLGKKYGKSSNSTKSISNKNNYNPKHKINNGRIKRSLKDDVNKILFSGKDNMIDDSMQYESSFDDRGRNLKLEQIAEKDLPFWGTRGRRESASDETVSDVQLPASNHNKYSVKTKILQKLIPDFERKLLRDELDSPFWGNRGRRDSDESKDELPEDLFWANRGRRQEDGPFWGTRGRRQEETPFWGHRGRRENFDASFWNSIDDDEPFWGNRGRRQEQEPFWGNRGRRETYEPFWGSRGKKKLKSRQLNEDIFNHLGNAQAQLEFKNYLTEAVNDLKNNIDNLAKFKRRDMRTSNIWRNEGQDSKIKAIIQGTARDGIQYIPKPTNKIARNELKSQNFGQNTVHDDAMFVEEPHYILVERSSRSSGEDDPFFITRGKKYNDFKLTKAVRDRRGALEEIVKSVRNDPYYIARGKKDFDKTNSTNKQSQYLKTKELVCATVDLLFTTQEGGKVKREAGDNERDRRTILKKLALQLQMDPYFVSRGKKNLEATASSEELQQFISKIIVLCHSSSK